MARGLSQRRPLSAGARLACAAVAVAALGAAPGTLDALVGELDGELDRALVGRPLARSDVALVVRGDSATSPELVGAVRRLLIARIARKGFRSQTVWTPPPDARRAEARARAAGLELLLDAAVSLVGGTLHLRAELIETDALLWRDLRFPARGAVAHLHASVRADAEVRAFQGQAAAPSIGFVEERVPLGARPVLAAGAADLDGDGLAELVLLHPGAVAVVQLAGARPRTLRPVTTVPLSGAAAVWSPRRAVGTVLIADVDGDRRPEVLVRSSLLEQALVLGHDGKTLVPRGSWPGFPLLVSAAAGARGLAAVRGATLEGGRDLFSAASFATVAAAPGTGAAGPGSAVLPARFYALQGASLVTPRRGSRHYAAVLDDSGRLGVLDGALRRELAALAPVGLAFDLLDLDDDGELDVVTTEPSRDGEPDGLSIHRLRGGKLQPRWRGSRAEGRIVAVTHAVLDGSGRLTLIGVFVDAAGKTSLIVVS